MDSDPQPDYERLTDREWSYRADRHAREALTQVGSMRDQWQAMVHDNRLMQSRLDSLDRQLKDALETISLLSGIILDQA